MTIVVNALGNIYVGEYISSHQEMLDPPSPLQAPFNKLVNLDDYLSYFNKFQIV